MKKIILCALMTAVMLFALCACGLGETKPQTTPAAEKPAEAEAPAPVEDVAEPEQTKDPITIRIAIASPDTAPVYVALHEVLEVEFAAETDGHITFEVYPASQLGDETQALELVKNGNLEMTATTTSPVAGLIPEFGVFDIPFLFESAEQAVEIMNGPVGEALKEKAEEYGIYVFNFTEFGFRHLSNSKVDVHTPADCEGLKIRTMDNAIHLATWRNLGANPTPMSVSEVFTAIQQGTIDGQENVLSGAYGYKIYEVNKHFTLTGHVFSPLAYAFNAEIFDSYDAEDQALIKEYLSKAADRSVELNKTNQENLIASMESEGVTVTRLTTDEVNLFREATISVWDIVAESAGSEIVDLMKEQIF